MSRPQVTAPDLTAQLREETTTRFVVILSIGGVVPASRKGALYIFATDEVGEMIPKNVAQKFRDLCDKIWPHENGPIAHLELSRDGVKKTQLVVQLHPESDSAKGRASVEEAITNSGIKLITDVSSIGGGSARRGIKKADRRLTRARDRGVRR